MFSTITSLATARALVIIGFAIGTYTSVAATFRHIGAEQFSPVHSWQHFLREGFGDIGSMVAVLLILFAAPRFRSPITWWIMLVLMLSFFAPYWVGIPFMPELASPNVQAEINHVAQAVPALLGAFLGRRHFFGSQS